jgi:hypothetical protein
LRYPVICLFGVLFLLSIVFATPVFARSEAKELYKGAEEKYSRGEVDEAIADLENALEIDSNFKKAKDLLLKILVTLSTEYYARGDYEKAFPYLAKTYNLVPEDAKVRYMYEIVSKELRAREAEKKAGELEAQRKAEEENRKAELEGRKKEEELLERKRLEEEERKRETEAKRKREEEKERRNQFEAKMKMEREETEKILLARKEEIEKASKEYEEIRNRLRQTIISGIIGIALSFLVGILLIFIIFTHSDRRFERRWKEERGREDEFHRRVEKILLQDQERILGLLEKHPDNL